MENLVHRAGGLRIESAVPRWNGRACGLTDTPKSRRWAGSATALPVQSREQISPCGPVPRFEDDAPARLIIGNRGDEIGPRRRAAAALVRCFDRKVGLVPSRL